MPTTIKLKNSVTTTNAPSSLAQGEIAINITDKKVWVGNAATTPIQLLGAGGSASFGALTCTSLTNSGLTSGRVTYATTGGLLTDSANLTFNGTTLTAAALTSTGVATFSAGTVSAPAITTTGDTNTGIFFPAADTIAFSEGGVEAMRLDSAGNVCIGTATAQLSQAGRGNITLNGSSSAIINMSTGDVNKAQIFHGGTDMFIGNQANGYLMFQTNATERMRITSGGDLLVGTSSTYTNSKVNVSGDINATRFHSYYFTETRTGNTTFYFYGNASQGQGNFNYANFGTGDILELSISTTGAANEAGCVWTGWTDGDNAWRTMSSYTQGELGSFSFSTGVNGGSGWVAITWTAFAPANSCSFFISIRRINRNSN